MDRLVADIGGTNARFALCGPDGKPESEQKLEVAAYPGVVEAARAYLAGRQVADAVFAVATYGLDPSDQRALGLLGAGDRGGPRPEASCGHQRLHRAGAGGAEARARRPG